MQPIDETGNEVELVGVRIIGFELVDEFSKSVNIFNNSGGLADVTELAENKFMLVTAETFMNQGTEARPVEILEKMIDGLEPTARSPLELHSGTANPHARINEIHFKVSLGLRNPKLGIITIEGWEVKFRKLASGDMMRGRWRWEGGLEGGRRLSRRGIVGLNLVVRWRLIVIELGIRRSKRLTLVL